MLKYRLLVYGFVAAFLSLGFIAPRLVSRARVRDPAVVRHWDWLEGEQSRWLEGEIGLFSAATPGVRVERTNVPDWARYREAAGAALAAGDEVDVYYLLRRATLQELIARGFAAPLTALDAPSWRSRYRPGDLDASTVAGEIYSFPIEGVAARVRVLLLNRRAFAALGVAQGGAIPATRTWDELLGLARRVKEAGGFGFGFGGRAGSAGMTYWLDLAQAAGGYYYAGGLDGFDPRTGRFEYAINPAYAGAVRVLLALRDQGSLAPGTMTLAHEDALAEFASGRFAMTFGTLDDLRRIGLIAPAAAGAIEVRALPRPEPRRGCSWYHTGPGRSFHLAPSASPGSVAWLAWLSSKEAAGRWVAAGLGPSVFDSIDPSEARSLEAASTRASPAYRRFVELAGAETCRAPDPARRHPDFRRLQIRSVTPDAVDVVEGVFAGRVALEPELAALDRRKEAALVEALDRLRAEGSTFDRAHLLFPDWEPGEELE